MPNRHPPCLLDPLSESPRQRQQTSRSPLFQTFDLNTPVDYFSLLNLIFEYLLLLIVE